MTDVVEIQTGLRRQGRARSKGWPAKTDRRVRFSASALKMFVAGNYIGNIQLIVGQLKVEFGNVEGWC